jgi:hypothetical protein
MEAKYGCHGGGCGISQKQCIAYPGSQPLTHPDNGSCKENPQGSNQDAIMGFASLMSGLEYLSIEKCERLWLISSNANCIRVLATCLLWFYTPEYSANNR